MHDLATEFETERDRLTAVAYRMLGSWTEAEDVVQETWLRYAAALSDPRARAEVRDLRAWLTTTAARLCLDVLRSARVRREAYPGSWLPEPIVNQAAPAAADGDPAERAVRTEQVGIALLTILEQLSPEQRVAFVLHDVFAVPFPEVAAVLGTSPAAARQLASRARRAISDETARQPADPAEHRRLLAAFLAAAESGDLDRLLAVLAPDVVLVSDSGGLAPANRRPIIGALKIARFALGVLRRASWEVQNLRVQPVLVNDLPGLQVEGERLGQPLRGVIWCTTSGGRIARLYYQTNPEKLTRVPRLAP
ncbi:RNA polymerase sigma factor SigJ [Micromonospora sp. HM5-17]|jgi:RNA polymerase sigma-70 factor (ECF subfamily)|uniref:RNA polymerase sigma factor SigJ n=1 Tax=Micromonospora sp. HM5-17 TaxID=2487710 RepID=UPI000F497446|nr:RNA polymerase sigma factor SigJ [Micromonospora sp. HM5-17]ROT31878.1 sigma-70 family RNA polymerase sigma factor [Micromonospora sp. HM5-17]